MVVIPAFLVALVVTPLAIRLARRVDLLDRPGELKVQDQAVPYLGGLGVAAGLAVGVIPARASLLLPLGLGFALGIVDDARSISAVARFLAEVAVGLAVGFLVPVRIPSVAAVLAVTVVTVVIINGVNMVDGLDGLAAGVALMSALGFAALLSGDARTIALALAGGLAGFLVFNRPPARIYLGDGGSYLVGTTLAVLLCLAWRSESAPAVSAGSLFLVACPVADLACAIIRRLRARRPLFMGDRSHPYDRLVDAGWSKTRAAGTYIAIQAVLSAVGVGVGRLGTAAATAVTAATIAGLLAVVATVSLQGSGKSKAAA